MGSTRGRVTAIETAFKGVSMPSGYRERMKWSPLVLVPSTVANRRRRGRIRTLEKGESPSTKAAACGSWPVERWYFGLWKSCRFCRRYVVALPTLSATLGRGGGRVQRRPQRPSLAFLLHFGGLTVFVARQIDGKQRKPRPMRGFLLCAFQRMSYHCHPFDVRFVVGLS